MLIGHTLQVYDVPRRVLLGFDLVHTERDRAVRAALEGGRDLLLFEQCVADRGVGGRGGRPSPPTVTRTSLMRVIAFARFPIPSWICASINVKLSSRMIGMGELVPGYAA